MTINLDMSKAYDKENCVYLEVVMRKLGFYDQWIKLMMVCATIVSYSILINGKPKGLIHPSRGTRQGDLFLLFYFSYALKVCMA